MQLSCIGEMLHPELLELDSISYQTSFVKGKPLSTIYIGQQHSMCALWRVSFCKFQISRSKRNMTSVYGILGVNRATDAEDGCSWGLILYPFRRVNTPERAWSFDCKWRCGKISTTELSRKNDLLTNLARQAVWLLPRALCLAFLLCGTDRHVGRLPACLPLRF